MQPTRGAGSSRRKAQRGGENLLKKSGGYERRPCPPQRIPHSPPEREWLDNTQPTGVQRVAQRATMTPQRRGARLPVASEHKARTRHGRGQLHRPLHMPQAHARATHLHHLHADHARQRRAAEARMPRRRCEGACGAVRAPEGTPFPSRPPPRSPRAPPRGTPGPPRGHNLAPRGLHAWGMGGGGGWLEVTCTDTSCCKERPRPR